MLAIHTPKIAKHNAMAAYESGMYILPFSCLVAWRVAKAVSPELTNNENMVMFCRGTNWRVMVRIKQAMDPVTSRLQKGT